MTDREKVISDLEEQITWIRDNDFHKFPGWGHVVLAMRDALALLKAQEPVEPRVGHDGWYRCGNCNNSLASGERVKHFYGHPWPKYCEECGKKVRWE